MESFRRSERNSGNLILVGYRIRPDDVKHMVKTENSTDVEASPGKTEKFRWLGRCFAVLRSPAGVGTTQIISELYRRSVYVCL